MGKKTVPIADQIILRRRVYIRTRYVIGVLPAGDNFRTIHGRNR
jgi:hypothetical protein